MIRNLEKAEIINHHYIEMDGLRLLLEMVEEGKAQLGVRDAWGNPTFQFRGDKERREFYQRLWDAF